MIVAAMPNAPEQTPGDLVRFPSRFWGRLSKLNSLCRMTLDREMAAFSAVDRLGRGQAVEYEVMPI